MTDPNYSTYLTWTSELLLERLADVLTELAAKNRELGFVEASHIQAKHAVYYNSQESSHAGRERDVEYATLGDRVSMVEIKTEIAVLNDEKFFIQRLLDGRKT